MYVILADIGNEHSSRYVLPLHQSSFAIRKWGGVYEFYTIFNTIMVSATINIALLTIIYIQYVNSIINKE